MEADARLVEQLELVRQDGGANMVSVRDVQQVANRLELSRLVIFCEECLRDRSKGFARYAAAMDKLRDSRMTELQRRCLHPNREDIDPGGE